MKNITSNTLKDMINYVKLIGKLTNLKYSHSYENEKFYFSTMCVTRTSGNVDMINVLISERLLFNELLHNNVSVYGTMRTYNQTDEYGNTHVLVYVFANSIDLFDKEMTNSVSNNEVEIEGYVCKNSHKRTSPFGRVITDLCLAVNTRYGKSYYIPTIFWGRNAKFADKYEIGTKVHIVGRIQSREYIKQNNGLDEPHIVYEISVSKIID